MDKALERELIQKGRDFLKSRDTEELEEQGREDYQTDQELKKPQPPLVKAPMGGAVTQLPRDFKPLALQGDFLAVVMKRKSSRVYTQEKISLLQLSFLLWVTQGIKEIRGKSYATLRTVPCGGARHPFETYLLVRDGMKDFKKKMDADEHGGALMLGVSKPVIKAHGSSKARAFQNAIRQAKQCVESGVVEDMRAKLGALSEAEEERA